MKGETCNCRRLYTVYRNTATRPNSHFCMFALLYVRTFANSSRFRCHWWWGRSYRHKKHNSSNLKNLVWVGIVASNCQRSWLSETLQVICSSIPTAIAPANEGCRQFHGKNYSNQKIGAVLETDIWSNDDKTWMSYKLRSLSLSLDKMTTSMFSVEDTTEKCYRDITSSLISRGLKMVPYRKKSKLDRRLVKHILLC